MSEKTPDDLVHILREQGARYVVGAEGKPVAVLLTLEEYDHYLHLLDDEAVCQDAELATRLARAAVRTTDADRLSLREYLSQRRGPHDEIPS
jgi:PHD/YefM family antitoxin component YafN of YafNO toxin-antitoxin module